MIKSFTALGIMSGSSLDGLDLAFCSFEKGEDEWGYQIVQCETIPYPEEWKLILAGLSEKTAVDLVEYDISYGIFLAEAVNGFLDKSGLEPELIASHGHTVFHQPQNKFTLQIGSGAHLFARTQIPVISDFRTQDVAMGGQEAPLVPIGDKLLFSQYDYCLNLGGSSNISFEENKQRIAFDIVPVNIVLNKLVGKKGFEYDADGAMGKKGNVLPELLEDLNNLPFYKEKAPKSLGYEWVEKEIFPLLDKENESIENLLATMYEHIAIQIGAVLKNTNKKVLLTGGGAYNSFLVEKIKQYAEANILQADDLIISYKEALIFAFLAYLKTQNKTNVLASVTGAKNDHIAGIIYS